MSRASARRALPPTTDAPRVLVVGGGVAGSGVARRLLRVLAPGEAHVTVVDPGGTTTDPARLAGVVTGAVRPAAAAAPLAEALRGAEVVAGAVTALHHAGRTARAELPGGVVDLRYDVLVLATGTVPAAGSRSGDDLPLRTGDDLPLRTGDDLVLRTGDDLVLRTADDAVRLRERVLDRLRRAERLPDDGAPDAERSRLLTTAVVGAGWAGTSAAAAVEQLARSVTRTSATLRPADVRVVLLGAGEEPLPGLDPAAAARVVRDLRRRGVEVHADAGPDALGDPRSWAGTVVRALEAPHPLPAAAGLPVDARGRLLVGADLRVVDGGGTPVPGAWGAGDGCAVPDAARPGRTCPPTADHAAQQARHVADGVVAVLRGGRPLPFRYRGPLRQRLRPPRPALPPAGPTARAT
ncbi:NAD(P)/FAD-dependent oxidoreductase [Kineococcus terrestris]|uniref:NAD(P)/FAD-dependent oxidoreductase n=1 Tax=Kineococcus terrestris TaxID=2044856 RepID=UPI0034DAC7BB